MSLTDALLLEEYHDAHEVYIAARTDGIKGSGSQADPFNGSAISPTIYPAVGISQLTFATSGQSVASVTTASNHDFATGDMVTVSGVKRRSSLPLNQFDFDIFYTGTFAITRIDNTHFTYVMLGAPASTAPDVSNAACWPEREQFDSVMRSLGPNTTIHVGPGVFESKGVAGGIQNWNVKDGQRIIGSGWGITTLKLVNASWPETTYLLIGHNHYAAFTEDFEASDLTFDCNIAGQPEPQVSCAAIAVAGRNLRLHRLRAINFSSQTILYVENFVFGVASPHPLAGVGKEGVNNIIEDCIAEQPGLNKANNSTGFILLGGENPIDGIMSWHRASSIRRCWYDGAYADRPVSIASIEISDGTATVTTRAPHNRSAGDWVVISGALENGSEVSAYNGSYKILTACPPYEFTYEPVGYLGRYGETLLVPTLPPTGDMWVDRFSQHQVSVKSVAKTGDGTIAILTCYGPHNRKPGQWVRVVPGLTLTAANKAYFSKTGVIDNGEFGIFPIIDEEVSPPNVLKYRMDAAPTDLEVKDVTLFLGVDDIVISTDGGSEAVAEGNRVFGAHVGGSYHDTWGTKDQTDRNNYYSDVLTGPYQNLQGSSGPKLGSSLVHDGDIATFTTKNPHGLSAGQSVTISGAAVNSSYDNFYNGTFPILSAPAPTSNSFSYSMLEPPSSNAEGSPVFGDVLTGTKIELNPNHPSFGVVAKFTTSGSHGFNLGDWISVFGATLNGSFANPYNGEVEVVDKDSTSFTYKLPFNPGAAPPDPLPPGTPSPKCAKAVGTPISIAGTTTTFRTTLPHGLVGGQAVRITPSLGNPARQYFAITSVPTTTSFTFEVIGTISLAPPYSFGAMWQVGLAVRDNNVIELGQAYHAHTGYGYSSGLPFYANFAHDDQYVFRRIIAKNNIIRLPPVLHPLARAIEISSAGNAVLENNIADIPPISNPIYSTISESLHFFNNTEPSGALVPPVAFAPSEPIDDDLPIRIESILALVL